MSNCKNHHPYPPGPCGPHDFAEMPYGDKLCPPGAVSPAVKPMPMKLAHAYVPYQYYTAAFNPTEALAKGTLFPELYSPYEKMGGC